MPSDPLPLSPEEIAALRRPVDEWPLHLKGWPTTTLRLLATLDREQEARTLARAEVIAEADAAVKLLDPSNDPDFHDILSREAVLAALSRLGERE